MTTFSGGTIDGSILPSQTGHDLGSAAQRWDGFFQDFDVSGTFSGALNPGNWIFLSTRTEADAGLRFAAAEAALASTGGVIVADLEGTQTIATDVFTSVTKNITLMWGAATFAFTLNTVIPANITQVFSQGSVLAPATTKTLTIKGSIQAPMAQIFGGAGTISFGGISGWTGRKTITVYPEWWGAIPDNATDVHVAFQAAIDAVGASDMVLRCGESGRVYYIGTTGLTVTNSGTSIRGPSYYNKCAIRYSGTGTAFSVGNGTDFIYDFDMANVWIAGTAGISASKGLSLRIASQFQLDNIAVGDLSDGSVNGFTDGFYFAGCGIGTVNNFVATGNTNGINLALHSVVGGNSSTSFSGGNSNLYNNTNSILVSGASSVSFRDTWAEWASNFLLIDNNGDFIGNAGTFIENLIFDNIRFINGPTSPFQGGHIISILASDATKHSTLRGIKFQNSYMLQNSTVAGTVVSAPIRINPSGAAVLLADTPVIFEDNIIYGGNTNTVTIDTIAIPVEMRGGLNFFDVVVGGSPADSAIFAGVGTTWNRTKLEAGVLDIRRPFLPNLILRSGANQGLTIDFYRQGTTRTTYLGNPNTGSDSFNIKQVANAAIYFEGHASSSIRFIGSALVGIGKADFTPAADLEVYDATAVSGITTVRLRAGAGQTTTNVLSIANSASDAETFGINESGVATKYNSIATVANGVPAEYAAVDLTAQTAAKTATLLYAVPAAGQGVYRVSWVATVTTAATTSCVLGGVAGFQVQFTSPTDSVVKLSNPTTPTISAVNATGTTISGTCVVFAKLSTNINYLFDYTSVGGTPMAYELHIIAEKL